MIHIAIVEDDVNHAEILTAYLTRYEKEHSVSFQIHKFQDGLDIITDYTADYDIILLDIQMKHMDGMKTAEKIRTMDEDVAIIFVTSTVQFAVQGYLVDALGYVVKPVPYLAFSQILSKAVRQLKQKQTRDYLTISINGGQMRLDINQIYYIESQRHNIALYTDKGMFLTAGPLKKFEADLISKGFFKCHNAYLVNLRHVMKILQNTVMLSGDIELPISRTRKKVFLDTLTDYLGGMHR